MATEQIVEQLKKLIEVLKLRLGEAQKRFDSCEITAAFRWCELLRIGTALGILDSWDFNESALIEAIHGRVSLLRSPKPQLPKEKQTYVKPKPLNAAQCACGNFFRCLEEIQLGICAVCISKQCDACPHDPSSSEECRECTLNQPLVPVSDPKEQETGS